MNSKHAERWEELRKVNPNLAMEYLRIYTTMDKAQKHFNNFKKECNDWLDNIYKDGVNFKDKSNRYEKLMEENKAKYKDVTEDFVYMIDAFSCDFDLAVQNENKLWELNKEIKNKNQRLLHDIDKLCELSCYMRHGVIKLIKEEKENE